MQMLHLSCNKKPNMPLIKIITSFQKITLFFSVFLNYFKHNNSHIEISSTRFDQFQEFRLLSRRPELEEEILIFDVEKALLKSPSLFPYFMLVAFEAGSPIRSLILFLLYPFITLLAEDFAVKAMVMLCFLGLKMERLIEGRAFLPKFFLEDVGIEGFHVLRRAKKTVAVSRLPRVMVECFLKDYLNVDLVVGRDLKIFHGYFLGVMEERSRDLFIDDGLSRLTYNAIGVVGSSRQSYFQHGLFSSCKEIYLVSDQERRNWHHLPRNLYPRPVILHDGRLAFRPTFLATLAMFAWVPIGIALAIVRIVICFTFPSKIVLSALRLTGIRLRVSKSKAYSNSINSKRKLQNKGVLYVCNHKTLFDPVAIFYSLGTPLTAVTYGVSRMSELLSNISTVRLTRDRDRDAELMRTVLRRGDLVVCPEGTTCREPYLLRFSPLFAEISDDIFPVAVDCHVGMFYGTTARGFKWLDPLFFLINPRPTYVVHFLDAVRGFVDDDGNSRFRVANFVQNEIAKELGFTCTNLTRKDKYLFLAGNDGHCL